MGQKETMEAQSLAFFFHMIRYSLEGGACPKSTVPPDWEQLYRICQYHKIEELVCYGLRKMPEAVQPPAEIMQKFSKSWEIGAAREAVQYFALEELSNAFEKEGIAFAPLKGIWMKQFYPEPELRMMADLDILFRPEQEEAVDRILVSQGYELDHRDNHHYVYFRKPFMNIEMHHCLFTYGEKGADYYKDVWARLRLQEGKAYSFRFSWEDYYIFMLMHFAKHCRSGGSGIRSIVDLWLFLEKMSEKLDWDNITGELGKLQLTDFERHMKKLSSVWFREEPSDEFYNNLTEFLIGSGVYGTRENSRIYAVIEKNGNRRTMARGKFFIRLKYIFPSYRDMCLQYAYLERYPWLLPAAWIRRILRTVFRRKGTAAKVLRSVRVNEKKAQRNQEIFNALGI